MNTDNGILASVPGDCVALGILQLPHPDSTKHEQITTDMDAREAGPVRITYRRRCLRHRKLTHWYWHAIRADPLLPEPSRPR